MPNRIWTTHRRIIWFAAWKRSYAIALQRSWLNPRACTRTGEGGEFYWSAWHNCLQPSTFGWSLETLFLRELCLAPSLNDIYDNLLHLEYVFATNGGLLWQNQDKYAANMLQHIDFITVTPIKGVLWPINMLKTAYHAAMPFSSSSILPKPNWYCSSTKHVIAVFPSLRMAPASIDILLINRIICINELNELVWAQKLCDVPRILSICWSVVVLCGRYVTHMS